jgi:putative phage-type endonuclease
MSRRDGIGGSDIGAVAGLNPYRSPMDVYMEKLGLTDEREETDFLYWGKALEYPIADRYRKEHPEFILMLAQEIQHDWRRGTPDRLAFEMGRKSHLLEIKTVGWRVAHRWGEMKTDQIPEEYLAQCTWYLSLTELPFCDVAALIGGNEYREYRVMRNLELEARLIEIGERFWFENVQKQIPPPPDSSETYRKMLAKIYPRVKRDLIIATPIMTDLALRLREVKSQIDIYESDKTLIENEIAAQITDAEGIAGAFGKIVWLESKFTRTDWKALAAELKISPQTIAEFTTSTPTRTLRTYWKKGE